MAKRLQRGLVTSQRRDETWFVERSRHRPRIFRHAVRRSQISLIPPTLTVIFQLSSPVRPPRGCCVVDWHATILHLLGFDHEKLTYRHAGRDMRLTEVKGNW